MKHIMTIEELDNFCQAFLFNIKPQSPFYNFFFNDLYNTGLRFTELKNIKKWTRINQLTALVPTLKGSLPRSIQRILLTDAAWWQIGLEDTFYSGMSIGTCCNWFHYFAPFHPTFVGTKPIDTHVFRHNRIKQLLASGKSAEEVQIYMGEKSILNIYGYQNSQIWYEI